MFHAQVRTIARGVHGNAGQRAEFGCTNSRVYRNADNETDLLVIVGRSAGAEAGIVP
jgi:hypothetical protein